MGGNLPDTNPGNDSVNVGVTGSTLSDSADLRVAKTARNATVIAGELQVYDIEIANAGPAASFDVVMTDLLTDLVNSATTGPGAGYVSISTVPGLAEGLVCSTEVTGPQSLRQTCDIDRLPVCTAGVDCPVVTITVRPGRTAAHGRTPPPSGPRPRPMPTSATTARPRPSRSSRAPT